MKSTLTLMNKYTAFLYLRTKTILGVHGRSRKALSFDGETRDRF